MQLDFHFPSKETLRTKRATIICMLLIVVSLYSVSYFLFMRTIDVDVTKDASITYRGETGTATVKVENKLKVYNQRIQEFMDSIAYQVDPKSDIANGSILTISATYDKEIARLYNINPINVKREVKVKNLPVRFVGAEKIPSNFLNDLTTYGNTYLRTNMDTILAEDFTSFYVKTDPTLDSYMLTYRVFLDSYQGSIKDKIIDIYAIKAKGDINTATQGEAVLSQGEETIYYMITYNEMNTSLKILDEFVYGEKMIVNSAYDLSNNDDFQRYVNDKYSELYHTTIMPIEKK